MKWFRRALPLVAVVLALAACPPSRDASFSLLQGGTRYEPGDTFTFPDTAVGTTAEAVVFTIENTSTVDLALPADAWVSFAGEDAGVFALGDSPSVSVVPAGKTTTFSLTFSPEAADEYSATVTVTCEYEGAVYTADLALAGTGTMPMAVYHGTTPIHEGYCFTCSDTPATTTSSVGVFTIRNEGDADLTLSASEAVSISGSDADAFTMSDGPGATTLGSGETATFALEFSPEEVREHEASLTVTSTAGEAEYVLSFVLAGAGTVPIEIHQEEIEIGSGAAFAFPDTLVNEPEPTEIPFTITNVGTVELTLDSETGIGLEGADALFFGTPTPSDTSVPPAGYVLFVLAFSPDEARQYSATATVTATLAGAELMLSFDVTGLGVEPPTITVTDLGEDPFTGDTLISNDGSVDFGTASILSTPHTRTRRFSVRNEGGVTLNLTGEDVVSLTGDDDFSVVAQPDDVVPPGEEVTFDIEFLAVESPGMRYATVTIDSDDPDDPMFMFEVTGTAEY